MDSCRVPACSRAHRFPEFSPPSLPGRYTRASTDCAWHRERALTSTGLLPPAHEPVTAPHRLDLPEHGFDRLPAELVQAVPAFRAQRPFHPLPGCQIRGDPSAGS